MATSLRERTNVTISDVMALTGASRLTVRNYMERFAVPRRVWRGRLVMSGEAAEEIVRALNEGYEVADDEPIRG